jgi:hypothetical protein
MNERILTVVNKSTKEQKLEYILPGVYKINRAKELVSGKDYYVLNDKLKIDVEGTGYLILKLE